MNDIAPNIEAPRNGTWIGEWERSFLWDTSMDEDAEGDPCWMREYLLHDGHEECCHHTDYAIIMEDE